jgi:UTP-glucose-1-phosphate uridylyltransferase
MIGIIPAAGNGVRLHGLPKFMLPVPTGELLLGRMMSQIMAGGARNYMVLTRPENKGLIDRFFNVGLLLSVVTDTMSETVLQAQQHCRDETCLLGMPDTYWTDDKVFEVLTRQFFDIATGLKCIANVGLWRVPEKYQVKRGMCVIDVYAGIYEVIDKPETPIRSTFGYRTGWGWGAIAWRPEFWQYIQASDPHVGYALQRAIDNKEYIQGYKFDGQYFDCGTPDEYFDCIRSVTSERQESAPVSD